ncbi:MAG: PD-(D/E)XK nuclease family protein [Clostridia bacterium]|nr:PD-(D/E)XK nuclease family protein [Clostridia bacterium]
MLHLIKGRAGSGKTAYMRSLISQQIDNADSKPLLIVPEQFSFESERSMLKLLGARGLKFVDVYSFSRLASWALSGTRTDMKIPGDGVRLALMSEAILALQGRLNIFDRCYANKGALESLVDFCKELKYCCIDEEELTAKTDMLSEGFLRNKLAEINIISSTYDALVSQSYFDDTDAIRLLYEYALDNNLFAGKTVYIDGFRAFSKQELQCFSAMLSQADDVYITLCCDSTRKSFSPFRYIDEFEKQLRAIAKERSIQVDEFYHEQNEDVFSKDVSSVERNIFNNDIQPATEGDGSLRVVQCFDIDDESRFVANEIKRLVRSGEYRCRDIAVIERSSGEYKDKIIKCLNRIGVPVFDDSRRSLRFEALFIYMDAILSCITSGFSQESVFTYLKSGLSPLDISSVSRLEKYALIWGVNGNSWADEFTMHPDGFGNTLDERAQKQLDSLNDYRKKTVVPLLKLKKDCADKTGAEISEAIYNFLCDQHVADRLFELHSSLEENGFSVEAQRQSTSWDMLMRLLDTIATLFGDRHVTLRRWTEIFNILVESEDIGEIPQGLDEVKVGSADRIRTEKLKVVFLVGVNKDKFPLVSIKNGVLTDSDRISLTAIGLGIRPPFEDTVEEERFIAYCAVTASSDKLYISYRTADDDGAALLPSEIVNTARDCVYNLQSIESSSLGFVDKIECDEDAFSHLASVFTGNSAEKATLLKYFEGKGEFEHRLKALERATNKKHFSFDNPENSKRLFGENIYLSASRVESFYNCPFSYFVRYGLRAEPLRAAELDPAQGGTVIHLVMETVLAKYPKAEFVTADIGELRDLVAETLKGYLEEKMGGYSGKSRRFMFLFERLVDVSMTIIERLRQEFKVGAFAPCDFEMKIGGEDIPAYKLPLDEGSVTLTGSVDRVDLMEKDGIKYIRVIDYKTGKKEFKLSELYSGLNVQMVLYLMALLKNGKDYYGEALPAGVLYLPSRIGVSDYMDSRSPDAETVTAVRRKSGKLSGMVLDSPVVFNGMGVDVFPDYFPVSYNKKNELTGNKYSLLNFNNLSKIIDDKIKGMGNSLHSGCIGAIPSGKDGEGTMCRYCSYKPICNHEFGDDVNEVISLTHTKALERLEDDSCEQ